MSSDTQPEFFLDRNLGTGFARTMEEAGWIVHRLRDVFPNDAQEVRDEQWIEYGCSQGWALLTRDGRIRYRADELGALDGSMFCLANGNLTIAETANRFLLAQGRIHSVLHRGHHGFWNVYDKGRIERKWP